MDRNENGINDKADSVINYILIFMIAIFAFGAYIYIPKMGNSTLIWILGFVVTIKGGESVKDKVKKIRGS